MDSDRGNPDLLQLKPTIEFQNRTERYDMKEVEMPLPSPPRQSFMQMFDLSSLLRQHPHKYKTIMKEDAAEDPDEYDAVDSKTKLERKLSERTKSQDIKAKVGKKLSQQRVKSAEKKPNGNTPDPSKVAPKRSSSYANIHEMKKSIPDSEEVQQSYFNTLSKELALGYDDYVYNHPLTDSEDESGSATHTPPVVEPQKDSLMRRHSMTSLSSFEEEPEMTTVKLPDGTEVKLPDIETLSQPSSVEVTPVNTPQASPRLRPRHELTGGHMGCVPVELQPERKKLFGVGPSYQPPSENVCVPREEAKQLNLLQRVVKEGFSAGAKTTFHRREDTEFFPPDQPQTQASIDSAKDLRKRFLTSADMNFLSPTSM